MLMQYEGQCGEHAEMSARNAIKLAAKYGRKVRMKFNGIALTVNRRLSVKHVVGTWQRMLDARALRYQNSPAGRAAKAKRLAEIAAKQHEIDALMADLPRSKTEAIEWIAKWVPLSDDVGVKKDSHLVIESLKALGFVKGEHVGDPAFKDGSATTLKRIEYIAGQVICMLENASCVHPMVGQWAAEIAV